MEISKVGSHVVLPEHEVEAQAVKPGSESGHPETEGPESEHSHVEDKAISQLPKRPLDDPAMKTFLSNKLGGESGYSGPQIRMDKNIIGNGEGTDDGGSDVGADAPSGEGWGLSKQDEPKSLNSNDGNVPKSGDDNNGPTRGAGFTFKGRPTREGDGHTKETSGGGTTNTGSTSSSSSSSSSSSGGTGTSSTTTNRQKK